MYKTSAGRAYLRRQAGNTMPVEFMFGRPLSPEETLLRQHVGLRRAFGMVA
jgi:hypothetical protein